MKNLGDLLRPYRKKLIAVAVIDGIGMICAILMPFGMSEIEKKGKISFRLERLEQYVRENPTKVNFAHAVKNAKQQINETMVKGNKLLKTEGNQQSECLENQH